MYTTKQERVRMTDWEGYILFDLIIKRRIQIRERVKNKGNIDFEITYNFSFLFRLNIQLSVPPYIHYALLVVRQVRLIFSSRITRNSTIQYESPNMLCCCYFSLHLSIPKYLIQADIRNVTKIEIADQFSFLFFSLSKVHPCTQRKNKGTHTHTSCCTRACLCVNVFPVAHVYTQKHDTLRRACKCTYTTRWRRWSCTRCVYVPLCLSVVVKYFPFVWNKWLLCNQTD